MHVHTRTIRHVLYHRLYFRPPSPLHPNPLTSHTTDLLRTRAAKASTSAPSTPSTLLSKMQPSLSYTTTYHHATTPTTTVLSTQVRSLWCLMRRWRLRRKRKRCCRGDGKAQRLGSWLFGSRKQTVLCHRHSWILSCPTPFPHPSRLPPRLTPLAPLQSPQPSPFTKQQQTTTVSVLVSTRVARQLARPWLAMPPSPPVIVIMHAANMIQTLFQVATARHDSSPSFKTMVSSQASRKWRERLMHVEHSCRIIPRLKV